MACAAGITLVTALLFLAYLRQSQQVPVRSDGGSIALQAWDMWHGNLLLHGWAMSDVSFWPTELVQYVLLEAVGGLTPNVVHIGGAMTYTLLVLLAAYLARGRASGREGAVRALVAALIMLAPAPGESATLLLTPDHLGSAVPVLLAWLAAERLPSRGWYTPAVVALLLAWGQVADGLILITGAAPMAVACGARAWAERGRQRRTDLGLPRTDLGLAAAAIVSVVLARAAGEVIRLRGGFVLKPVATRFVGWAAMPYHVKVTVEGLLSLFGADFSGPHSRAGLAIAALHLFGAAVAAMAFVVALRRLGRAGEPAVPALALAIVFNVTAFLPTTYVQNLLSTREISAVLPFGAVLAGRVLGAPLARSLASTRASTGASTRARTRAGGRMISALAAAGLGCAVLGCAGVLGYHAAQPAVPAQNQSLATWLAARQLTNGLSSDYWVANSTTLDAGARVTVRQVTLSHGVLVHPLSWGFEQDWYDPATSYADFLVAGDKSPGGWGAAAFRTFGPPGQALHPVGYTVLVWHKNLLGDIR